MSLSQAEDLAGSLPALLRAYECRAASEIALALRNMAADNVAGAESASSGDPFVNQLVSHYAVSRAHGLVRLSQCYRTLPVRCVFLCYELWLASCFCMLPCTLCMGSAARAYTRNTSVSLHSPFLLLARRNKAYARTYVPRLRQGAWLYPR